MSLLPRFARPVRGRAGIVVGIALALVGITVGTATGAVTPFQQVIVVNPPSSPVPVSGSVSVTNTPANQNVTVTNFPTTQAVSGTVSVSNLPTAPTVTFVLNDIDNIESEELQEFPFGKTVNVSKIILYNEDDDGYILRLMTVAGGEVRLWVGSGSHTEDFPVPVPATGVNIWCRNLVLDCRTELTVFGS